ncbi:D-amino-acid transaminase chloroplastic, partial [Bienertia sinuspersici]
AIERLRLCRMKQTGKQKFLAMYSSVFGGITTDPTAMVIPMDDHMVHRGHGVFDTAAIADGLPFDRETMRSILIQTVSVSKCRNGSLRYWLSAGYGDFVLSPSGCAESAFYAVVTQTSASSDHKGIKVITSSIPIKPPMFATMKSVNYLPNALCQMEAEENGCFASIWLDSEGFIGEGPNTNVAFVTREKELLMPKFDKVLSGCTAKRVLALSEELRKKGEIRGICVRDVTVEEGKKAEEMMLLGSGVLVRPIVQWDDQVIGSEGPIARALLDLLLEDMKSGPSTVRVRVPY